MNRVEAGKAGPAGTGLGYLGAAAGEAAPANRYNHHVALAHHFHKHTSPLRATAPPIGPSSSTFLGSPFIAMLFGLLVGVSLLTWWAVILKLPADGSVAKASGALALSSAALQQTPGSPIPRDPCSPRAKGRPNPAVIKNNLLANALATAAALETSQTTSTGGKRMASPRGKQTLRGRQDSQYSQLARDGDDEEQLDPDDQEPPDLDEEQPEPYEEEPPDVDGEQMVTAVDESVPDEEGSGLHMDQPDPHEFDEPARIPAAPVTRDVLITVPAGVQPGHKLLAATNAPVTKDLLVTVPAGVKAGQRLLVTVSSHRAAVGSDEPLDKMGTIC